MTWFLPTSSCMYITLSLEFIKSEKHLVPHLEDPINKKKGISSIVAHYLSHKF